MSVILQDQGRSKKKTLNTTELNNTERVRLSIPKTAAAAAGNDAAAINIHNYRLHIYQSAIRIQTNARDLQSSELILRVRAAGW